MLVANMVVVSCNGIDDYIPAWYVSLRKLLGKNVRTNKVVVTEKFHFNRHFWDLEFKWFPFQRHYVMAIYALFSIASGLVKMSILLFYRRLSTRTVSSAYRWTLRITIASIGLSTGKT
jgi:hypothetical protein